MTGMFYMNLIYCLIYIFHYTTASNPLTLNSADEIPSIARWRRSVDDDNTLQSEGLWSATIANQFEMDPWEANTEEMVVNETPEDREHTNSYIMEIEGEEMANESLATESTMEPVVVALERSTNATLNDVTLVENITLESPSKTGIDGKEMENVTEVVTTVASIDDNASSLFEQLVNHTKSGSSFNESSPGPVLNETHPVPTFVPLLIGPDMLPIDDDYIVSTVTDRAPNASEMVRYKNYTVINVLPTGRNDLLYLLEMRKSPEYDFWSHIFIEYNRIRIMLTPNDTILPVALWGKINFSTEIYDVDEVFSNQKPDTHEPMSIMKAVAFQNYHKLSETYIFLQTLRKYHSNVELLKIGHSTEKRPLYVVKVARPAYMGEVYSIFVTAGMHGREWLSTSIAMFAIHSFVSHSERYSAALEHIIWYFLPIANPDGYKYSMETDRLWSKTRSRQGESDGCKSLNMSNHQCCGVSLSHNFDTDWTFPTDRCTRLYSGPAPFSEPESEAIRRFVAMHEIHLFLNLHSTDNYIAYPSSGGSNYEELLPFLDELGLKVKQSVEGSDRLQNIPVGPTHAVFGIQDGSATDWIGRKTNITFAYTISLLGKFPLKGFDVAPEHIFEACEHNLVALATFAIELQYQRKELLRTREQQKVVRRRTEALAKPNIIQELGFNNAGYSCQASPVLYLFSLATMTCRLLILS